MQPASRRSPLSPPCLQQRPLRAEAVVPPTMEHGFFFHPLALVVHPPTLRHPFAPCLRQWPRARARVLQPLMSHTFVLPPCLGGSTSTQSSYFWGRQCVAIVKQAESLGAILLAQASFPSTRDLRPSLVQNHRAPCFSQISRTATMWLQPEVEQAVLSLECLKQVLPLLSTRCFCIPRLCRSLSHRVWCTHLCH